MEMPSIVINYLAKHSKVSVFFFLALQINIPFVSVFKFVLPINISLSRIEFQINVM